MERGGIVRDVVSVETGSIVRGCGEGGQKGMRGEGVW